MSQSQKRQEPAGYRLRVTGHLDPHWSPWFGDLTLTHEDDGTTSLAGAISDQAQLHGLLTKIRDLGVTLISVTVVGAPDNVDHQPDPAGNTPEVLGELRIQRQAGYGSVAKPDTVPSPGRAARAKLLQLDQLNPIEARSDSASRPGHDPESKFRE